MFPVTLKSSSGGNKNSQSSALCQWSEVPQHPGLVCCLTHTGGVPVVLMIKPHQILVQPKPSSVSIVFVVIKFLNGNDTGQLLWVIENNSKGHKITIPLKCSVLSIIPTAQDILNDNRETSYMYIVPVLCILETLTLCINK